MAARLYVGNLPYGATEDGLRGLFSQAGAVVSVALPVDRDTGRPRGFGFVEMESNADAEEAVRKFDGYQLDNRMIRVQVAREREARPPGFRPSTGRGMGYGFGERREGRRPEGRRGRGRAA
ncbi:MAG: RNA-binding protein [Chloroflexi bacterium]|nr:RNA-binding protein [Chloroflexota bacterium]